MAVTAPYIEAPPVVPPSKIGRLLETVPVIENADSKIGFGAVFDRDLQVNGTATWPGPCEEVEEDATKDPVETFGTVTAIPFTVWQSSKCRMLNQWDKASDSLRTLFENGEHRTVEAAFVDALTSDAYGTVVAGPVSASAAPVDVFATAEAYIAENGGITVSYILANPEIVTYAVAQQIVFRIGNHLETALGTPVIALVGLTKVFVTGQIDVWRSPLVVGEPVQVSPYDNEYNVLAERIYTIAVEGDEGMGLVSWSVSRSACCSV